MVASSWVFSKKTDLWVFTGPILLSLFLFFLNPQKLLTTDNYTFHLAFIQTYINLAHLYSTFWFTYGSKTQWVKHSFKFISIPASLFAFNLMAGSILGVDYIYCFFSHFSIWHFIKQQQAWFFISKSKGMKQDKLTHYIDVAAIYACTIGFSLVALCEPNSRGWFLKGDLFELPGPLRDPLLIISVVCVCLYPLRHCYLFYKSRQTNWGTHHIFLCALLIWGYSRLGPWNLLTYYLNQFHHAIPYFVLAFLHLRRQVEVRDEFWLPKWPTWLLGIFIFLGSCLFANFEMNLRDGLGLFSTFSDSFEDAHALWIMAFFNTTNITHYVVDKFYWEKKHNPDWVHALGP